MSDTSPADRDELRAVVAHAIYPKAALPWMEEAERVLAALDKAGLCVVPKRLTDEMTDAACECDAFDKAVFSNQRRHDERVAKGHAGPRKRGAAPIEYLPEIWTVMLASSPFSVSKDDAN